MRIKEHFDDTGELIGMCDVCFVSKVDRECSHADSLSSQYDNAMEGNDVEAVRKVVEKIQKVIFGKMEEEETQLEFSFM